MKNNNENKIFFARHETFHLRDGWITKGLQLIQDGDLSKPDAHNDIGVGINMLKSIRYWLEATNLIRGDSPDSKQFSDLGKYIFKNDKYFEDNASLWMIHYQLCINTSYAPVWHYIFSINQESAEFELSKTEHYIQDHFSKITKKNVSINSIIKDLRCLARTYISEKSSDDYELGSPLSELNLIHKLSGENTYSLNYGVKDSLPLEVFLICLINFAKSNSDVEIGRLRFNVNSPGRIFCLSFDAIRDYIAEACHKYPKFFNQIRTYESEEFRILENKKVILKKIYQNIY